MSKRKPLLTGGDAYRRQYKMRALGQNNMNIVVSIPRVVIAREAARFGITVREFLTQFRAVAHYDDFDGVLYSFQKMQGDDAIAETSSETQGTGPVSRRAT